MTGWKFKSAPIPRSEITRQVDYMNRKQFLKAMGIVGAGALLAACAPNLGGSDTSGGDSSNAAEQPGDSAAPVAGSNTDELGDPINTYEEITNYNNFYEFTISKEAVAMQSENFKTSPWEVEVSGLCSKPGTFNIESLTEMFPPEERIYRLRCVEAWSMVIPWNGFELGKLLEHVEPTPEAKYVRFVTLYDPVQFPSQNNGFYPWPYEEGLRMDEAMHPLTILATGLYGEADAQPEWSAHSPGGPLEIRFQEHQVHRQD